MKKLFTLMFASILAVCAYANNEFIDLSEINIDANQIKLKLDFHPEDYPTSGKAHESNTHNVTVNLDAVDLESLNYTYPVGTRYWGEAWSNMPHNYDVEGLSQEEADTVVETAANEFAEKFESSLKKDFLASVKRHTESAVTECKMVKISANWLVGLSTCLPQYIRTNPEINSKDKEDVAFRSFMYTEKEFRWIYFIDSIEIEGITVSPAGNMFINQDLILIRLSNDQVNNTKKFVFSREVGILPSQSMNSIKSVYLQGKQIEGFTIDNSKLIYKRTKTSAGTPIFGENDKYEEFLLGFNSAKYESFTRGEANKFFSESGKEYKLLTADMKEFIKTTMASVKAGATKQK